MTADEDPQRLAVSLVSSTRPFAGDPGSVVSPADSVRRQESPRDLLGCPVLLFAAWWHVGVGLRKVLCGFDLPDQMDALILEEGAGEGRQQRWETWLGGRASAPSQFRGAALAPHPEAARGGFCIRRPLSPSPKSRSPVSWCSQGPGGWTHGCGLKAGTEQKQLWL